MTTSPGTKVQPFDEDNSTDPDEIPFFVTDAAGAGLSSSNNFGRGGNRRTLKPSGFPPLVPTQKASSPNAGTLQRKESFGTVYITSGENVVAGVASNANSDAECVMMWTTLLERYGGFDEASARHIATLFSDNDFPIPTPELDGLVRHEDLERLGVQTLGERLRVMVAIKRAPPPPKGMNSGGRASTAGTRSTLSVTTQGFIKDPSTVRVVRVKPPNHSFEWIELVGKDLPRGDGNASNTQFAQELRRIQSQFVDKAEAIDFAKEEAMTCVSARRPGSSSFRNRRGSVAAAFHTGEEAPEISTSEAEFTAPNVDPFDIFNVVRPLPCFFWNPRHPHYMSFVLRVPNLGDAHEISLAKQHGSDEITTMTQLSSRWIVVVDSRTSLITTVHRVDNVHLARLRDKKSTIFDSSMTLRQMIINVFIAFLGEFELVLDEVSDLLDENESKLLDRSKARDLVVQLVHLQRRMGVYIRLLDLNQAIIRHVGSCFNCRDMSEIETSFHDLRERCVALDARTVSVLNLVLALSGHRTSEVMTVLTKLSMCLSPCTLITGIYGMNFRYMPELDYEPAYFIVLGTMAVLIVCLYSWMRLVGV